MADIFARRTSHAIILFDARVHDVQQLAVFGRSIGRSVRKLPVRLEEVGRGGRHRTLSLINGEPFWPIEILMYHRLFILKISIGQQGDRFS